MQTLRDLGRYLRRLVGVGIVGVILIVLDIADVYDRFVKGGPIDPATFPEPIRSVVNGGIAVIDANLALILILSGSFLAFREERTLVRQAEKELGEERTARVTAEDTLATRDQDLKDVQAINANLMATGLGELWRARTDASPSATAGAESATVERRQLGAGLPDASGTSTSTLPPDISTSNGS